MTATDEHDAAANGLRLAYFGTGPFAVPALRALIDSQHAVELVVTQPDRTGRGHHRHVNPLKELATEHSVAVSQPANVNDADFVASVWDRQLDLLVTASYGQYLSKPIRQSARLGAINLHGSILPKYRGAAPVQRAIWNRESESGVSVFQIEKGMDTGPVFDILRCPVHPTDTSADLFERLAELSAKAAIQVVDTLADGTAVATPQDESQATHAAKLTKEDGLIDWTRPAEAVRGQVLATQPWPKASTHWKSDGRQPTRLILLGVTPCGGTGQPGEVIAADGELVVACGEGAVRVDRLQVSGKQPVDAAAFLNGHSVKTGDRMIIEENA